MSRYNLSQIPETIIIYRIEYNLKMKNYEEAALLIHEAYQRHPDHMVYKVYSYIYDIESEAVFTESDKDHWLYKEKIQVSEE